MKTRIQQLRQRIREATGQVPVFDTSPDCPAEVEEAFLSSVLAFEMSPKRTLMDLLCELGIELPRPRKLTDSQLTAKLWQVIQALLSRAVVLCNTDHLSDREFYTLLWHETLRQEFVICPHYTTHVDMTKGGIDDGMGTYLKYYASEEQRRMYAEVYPDFEMPEHVEPPCRRDHLIPDVP
jgi:hypothetical protein